MDPAETKGVQRLVVLAVGLTMAAQLAYRLRYQFGPIDDAYIHLRVAFNLAHGNGPVFNVGDRVEVTSSPLWTLLLAAALKCGLSGEAAVSLLAIGSAGLAGGATAVLGFQVAGARGAILASVLLAALPSFEAWAGSGMETPLAIAGFAAATASMLATRSRSDLVRTALLSAFLCYLRPELVACLPALMGIALFLLPRPQRASALAYAALAWLVPVAALFLTRHWYFGEWLPNTYYAKVSGGGLAQRLLGIRYVLHFAALHPVYVALAAASLPAGSFATRAVGIVLANFLTTVVWAGGDGFYFARLALPALPLLVCLAAAFLGKVRPPRLQASLAVAALAVQVLWSWKGTLEFPRYLVGPMFAENNVRIAKFMQSLPAGTIATVGIGALAYASERPILDLVGLADKHIARSRRVSGAAIGHNHFDNDYVLGRNPEYVLPLGWLTNEVTTSATEMRGLQTDPTMWMAAIALLEDEHFRARYQPRVYRVDDQYLRIWLRGDLLASVPAGEPVSITE